MIDAAPPAPAERGWGKLLLALAAFLFLPHLPPLNALLPVEDTLLLLLPALAACCLVGWWAGGRFSVALVWVALAVWAITQARVPGSFYSSLLLGWTLLLSGGFGLICLFGIQRTFFSRAMTAVALALTLVLVMSARSESTASRAKQAMQSEFARRNAEALASAQLLLQQYPEVSRSLPKQGSTSVPDAVAEELKATSDAGTALAPSLVLLESLVALALAWTTYHRISRTRLGAPLAPLKDFRFNDQLVWGLIAGLAIVFLPALDFMDGAGRNLLVFFGALYAIRGFGVLSWFMKPGSLAAMLVVGFVLLWAPVINMVAILGLGLLALAAFGLGLGDTWADWRRRARPTT